MLTDRMPCYTYSSAADNGRIFVSHFLLFQDLVAYTVPLFLDMDIKNSLFLGI